MTNKHQGWQPVSDDMPRDTILDVWVAATPDYHAHRVPDVIWDGVSGNWRQAGDPFDFGQYQFVKVPTHYRFTPPPPEQEGGL